MKLIAVGFESSYKFLVNPLGDCHLPFIFRAVVLFSSTRTTTTAVRLSCYKLTTETGWFINNEDVFLTGLETEKSTGKPPADLVSSGNLLPGSCITIFSLCPHKVEEAGSSLEFLS